MRRSYQNRYISYNSNTGQGPGLIARIVAFALGIVVFGAAVFVGAVFIAGLVGLILIGAVVIMIRVWWLRRQMERYAREHGDLSAEYTVIKDDEKS
ncbi:MAG: hypothetical protein P8Y61_10365 [Gammaproteobacteria bacterium]|jgi:hypothetical protein